MSKIPEWKQKRKKALIAICTLGLSEAPIKMLFTNSQTADRGFSFEGGPIGFVFKCMWFVLWTMLTSVVMWVINIFKFLNYSIAIAKYDK